MHTKSDIPTKIKAVGDEGQFTAYASTFHREADSWGDIVAPGAFAESIKKWRAGKTLPILWNHDANDPFSDIGVVTSAEEDAHGLKVTGQLDIEDNDKAAQVFKLIKGGRIDKMSFGFTITDSARISLDGKSVRELRGIDLSEVSLVRYPANEHAEVLAVKDANTDTKTTPKTIARKDVPMNLKNQLKAAVQAEYDAKEALEANYTAANLKAVQEAVAQVKILEERIADAKAANAALDALSDPEGVECGDGPNGPFRRHATTTPESKGDLTGTSRATKGQAFANAVKSALYSKGLGDSELGNVASLAIPYAEAIVSDPRKAFSLENLVNRRLVETGSGQYLAQTLRDNQATSVPRGELKPTSSYGMEARTWELSTLAHLSEPISRQWLEDMRHVSQWLSVELAYGLSEAVDQFILNGGASESGNEITGLLNTEGVEEIAYRADPLRSIRRAIGSLDLAGITANGIAMHPLDWEGVELLADAEGRTLLAPVGQSAARQLWSVPVTLSAGIPQGQAIVADWTSIFLLNRGVIQMKATETAALMDADGAPAGDLFSRNQLIFRCEQRVGLTMLSLPSIRKVELAKP